MCNCGEHHIQNTTITATMVVKKLKHPVTERRQRRRRRLRAPVSGNHHRCNLKITVWLCLVNKVRGMTQIQTHRQMRLSYFNWQWDESKNSPGETGSKPLNTQVGKTHTQTWQSAVEHMEIICLNSRRIMEETGRRCVSWWGKSGSGASGDIWWLDGEWQFMEISSDQKAW